MINRSTAVAAVMLLSIGAKAQNPFVQTWCTSDPAPLVHNGTMYVYTGHDEDGADFFWMQEWRVYSTQDMVNWQDHGSPLALESFSWPTTVPGLVRLSSATESSTGISVRIQNCRAAWPSVWL